MGDITVQFDKGAFQNVDAFELTDPSVAATQKNVLVDDAGSLVDRPALSLFASIGSYPVTGIAFFGGYLVAVTSDRSIFSVSSTGVVADITGTALLGTARPYFEDDGSYLAICGGAAPRRWSGSGNTALMPGSPPSCSHMALLDSYWITFLLSDQELRWAGPTSALRESWNSSQFFSAEALSDDILSVAVLNRELYAFGGKTTEVFQNFGDSSVPFQRSFVIPKGIGAAYSVIGADNTLHWLSNERQFVQLQGRNPIQLSGPFDRVIRGFTTVSDCWGQKIDIGGHYLLAWTFPTEERTFVYDYKRKLWSEWDGFRDGQSDRWRAHSYCFAESWNKHFVGDFRSGTIWELNLTSKVDGTDTLRRLFRTGEIDLGTGKKKRCNSMRFHVKRGLGPSGGTEPRLQVRWRDDGGSWTEPKYVSLGLEGRDKKTYTISKCGIFEKRILELSMTDAYEFRLNKIDFDIDVIG